MMTLKNKTKIYSQFEINVILFYATMIMMLPCILVITYAVGLDERLNINIFMLWLIGLVFVVMIAGTVILMIRKDHLKRRVKAGYRSEYLYLIFLTAFGVLGFCVLYDYAGGDRAYIANVLVLMCSGLIYLLLILGRKFFKFDYMKKK
jgi:nitrate reductase gamma subunit